MCLKCFKGMFSPNVIWHLFRDTSAVILQRKSEIAGDIFAPALEMPIRSILLKYQEIEVQRPTFTDEDSNILHRRSFEWY